MARENWASSIGFILAAAGSAIGLGNIWKFPYVAGQNGGGTFVLVYVLCILTLGLPVMCAEMLIGRHTHRNVINAMGKIEALGKSQVLRWVLCLLMAMIAIALGTSAAWGIMALSIVGIFFLGKKGFAGVGWICAAVALMILSYYAVVGGWIVDYSYRAAIGGLNFGDASLAKDTFKAYIASPGRVVVGFLVFIFLTGAVIIGGIRSGIERVCKVLMPALFILLLIVIGRSVTLPGAMEGIRFFLKPSMKAFSSNVVLMAMGQAFYSMSLGMAITITYGSYLHRQQNILKAAGWVCVLDTIAAILGGLAIFPAVFAMGQAPNEGPGLIFATLPITFQAMPFGRIWATCFFMMLLIAAVTSAASLLECGATVFIERIRRGHKRCSRWAAVTIGYVFCTLMGLLVVFSTRDWSYLPWLEKFSITFFGELTKGNWFDTLDFITSYWCLPFTALCISLLVGWGWSARKASSELLGREEIFNHEWLLRVWELLIRWVAPIIIVIIFLTTTGILRSFK